MFLLNTTDPAELTGKAAELFAMFPPQLGVPAPLQLLSASPGLVGLQAGVIEYYRAHPELDFPMLASIRYLAAKQLNAPACVDFNARLLRAAGLEEDEIAALPGAGGEFTPAQRALLAFCLQVLAEPQGVAETDVAELRAQGWSDATILDAVGHAANMQVPALLMKAFMR